MKTPKDEKQLTPEEIDNLLSKQNEITTEWLKHPPEPMIENYYQDNDNGFSRCGDDLDRRTYPDADGWMGPYTPHPKLPNYGFPADRWGNTHGH